MSQSYGVDPRFSQTLVRGRLTGLTAVPPIR